MRISSEKQRLEFSASQDGFLSAWSTLAGIHLAAFHFNHPLTKLNVSQSGGRNNHMSYLSIFFILFLNHRLLARYAAILQNTSCLAMLSLFNISSNDASKIPQRHSQSKVQYRCSMEIFDGIFISSVFQFTQYLIAY